MTAPITIAEQIAWMEALKLRMAMISMADIARGETTREDEDSTSHIIDAVLATLRRATEPEAKGVEK